MDYPQNLTTNLFSKFFSVTTLLSGIAKYFLIQISNSHFQDTHTEVNLKYSVSLPYLSSQQNGEDFINKDYVNFTSVPVSERLSLLSVTAFGLK